MRRLVKGVALAVFWSVVCLIPLAELVFVYMVIARWWK